MIIVLRQINCKMLLFHYRGVGCIFYEMACGRPLFPGSTVEDELHLIFKILGTPTDYTWPQIAQHEDFIAYNFPHYEAEPLINHAPRYAPLWQPRYRKISG